MTLLTPQTREHIGKKTTSAADIAQIITAILNTEEPHDREREHFYIIGFDVKMKIKYIELAFLGSLTSSIVHPRETYRNAIHHGAATIICAHNHPSGDTEPSRDDRALTDRLREAGEILGIKLLDRIVITEQANKYYSFLEHGDITA